MRVNLCVWDAGTTARSADRSRLGPETRHVSRPVGEASRNGAWALLSRTGPGWRGTSLRSRVKEEDDTEGAELLPQDHGPADEDRDAAVTGGVLLFGLRHHRRDGGGGGTTA